MERDTRAQRWSRRVRALVERFGLVTSPGDEQVEVAGTDVTDLVASGASTQELPELVAERLRQAAS